MEKFTIANRLPSHKFFFFQKFQKKLFSFKICSSKVLLLGLCLWACLLTTKVAAQQVSPNFVNVESYPSSVSSVTVTMPAGSEVGDVVLVYIVTDDDGTITAPVDFTQLANFYHDGNGPLSGLFYRIITGAELPSYSFSFDSEPAVVATLRYQNLNTTMPFMAQVNVTGDSNSPMAPSVNTTRDNITYLQFIGIDGSSAGVLDALSPSATVLVGEQSGESFGAEMLIASELQATAGSTPMGAFTFSGATDEWTAVTLALNNYFVDVVSPVNTSCSAGNTTITANYVVGTASGNFELVDPSGTVLATESYATSSGVVSFTFTPMQTGNYTVREQTVTSISSAVTIYIDTDGDTVCDKFDMDDDNDGVIDNVESPNCFFSLADFPYESGNRTSDITVTTDWTVNSGSLINILDGNTTGNAVRKTNGDFAFSGQEFLHFTLPHAVTFDQITLHHEGDVFLDASLVGVVQGSNDGAVWTDLTTSGIVLPDAASPHTINLTQNLGDFSHYRIYVSSGTIDDDEYLREVEFSMVFNPLNYPKSTCTDDADGDLVYNHLDLDSDGDGCSDAFEAGATADLTANFQFPSGSVGANGLADLVETPVESGILNYVVSYNPSAINDLITTCLDRDGDSIIDAYDLDADNDGILNIVEMNAPCPGDGLLNYTSYNFPSNLGNTSQLPGQNVTGMGTSSSIGLVGLSGNRFGLIFTGYLIVTENGSHTFNLNSDDGSSLHINGVEEITTATNTANVSLTIGWHQIEVRFYENTGGESLALTYQPPSAASAISIPSQLLSTAIPECDDDGIPNHLDLDSDNDGIPDNIEGQATLTYVAPASNTPAQYVANNGVNTAYLGGLTPPDTESDGFPDFLDLESDADRILDAEESGLPLTGLVGANGLDMGVKTSDDYADVNGIVDDPNTILAHVTTNTTEADYRDKQPPPTITVCYNADSYGMNGSRASHADDKILNPANFGEFGIGYVNFQTVSIGTANDSYTPATLAANGCQIVYLGGSNSDALSFNPGANALTFNELDAVRDWALSPNNVLIAFQGHSSYIGGADFAGDGVNSNPNELTEIGENIVSGAFGNATSFNQGGSFQGRFTSFPNYACAITQDDNENPTGLLNAQTGDFYLADYGLIGNLGGLTSSANISSNTDVFYANLMLSAAQIVLEGPSDACSFFYCPAGDVAPGLITANVSSAGIPVDLNNVYTGTPPAGTMLTWHTASPPADDNYIGNATAYLESGIVYAAYRADDGSCYSPASPLMITVNYPDLAVSISPATETSAEGEFQMFTITVTNNGAITAPDAIVKVPVPAELELILANPSTGTYNGSSSLWNIGTLANGQSVTLDITVKL